MSELQRALLRVTMAESQLSQFDAWRDPNEPQHDRVLRKLRSDLEKAEIDLAYAERQQCNG
jgi:hypothetical protein